MNKDQKKFESGDLVFARVRGSGYPFWPGRVTGPADKNCTKFYVFFYGAYDTGTCNIRDICIYNAETKAKYGRQKRRFFVEALDEIENRPDIVFAAQGNTNILVYNYVQAALVIRGGYVPQKYREYQNCEYQVQ